MTPGDGNPVTPGDGNPNLQDPSAQNEPTPNEPTPNGPATNWPTHNSSSGTRYLGTLSPETSPVAATLSPLSRTDPLRIGHYRLLGRLGAGGMGRVYLGRSLFGHLVAIKVIRDDLADEEPFRARFRRELLVASRVTGPFTARIMDADVDAERRLWIATEYVPGPSLREAVTTFGPLPPDSLLSLWLALLGALETFHSAGVVHRDLKPSNVLLATQGPRVIDFGISTSDETSNITHTGIVLGTPSYMAPEQAVGDPAGPPADVFALGSVLMYAATGRSPFSRPNATATMFSVVHTPPDLTGLSDRVADLVARCLDKDPDRRPTVTQLLDDLTEDEQRRAAALLAQGKWLPPAVERRALDRARAVEDWGGGLDSVMLPALPSPQLPDSGPNSTGRPQFPPSAPPSIPMPDASLAPSPPRSALPPYSAASSAMGADDTDTAMLYADAPAPPNTGLRPPVGGSEGHAPQPPPAARTDDWGGPPDNDHTLRTTTSPLDADPPPLPRLRRTFWRLGRRGPRGRR